MDNKKIIEALVKIANNQQKIIHKLAQQNPMPTTDDPSTMIQMVHNEKAKSAPMAPKADHLQPNAPKHTGLGAGGSVDAQVRPGLSQATSAMVSSIVSSEGKMTVYVKPGFGRAQAAEVQKAVRDLEASGAIMSGHKLNFQRG